MLEKKLLDTFYYYLYKLISFANDSILWFFSSELHDSKSFISSNSKRKKRVTYSAENNTFIWNFGDLIASTDHVKGKSLEVLAVKDLEVGAFVRRDSLTSVIDGKKMFQEGKYIGYHKNSKITQKPQKQNIYIAYQAKRA